MPFQKNVSPVAASEKAEHLQWLGDGSDPDYRTSEAAEEDAITREPGEQRDAAAFRLDGSISEDTSIDTIILTSVYLGVRPRNSQTGFFIKITNPKILSYLDTCTLRTTSIEALLRVFKIYRTIIKLYKIDHNHKREWGLDRMILRGPPRDTSAQGVTPSSTNRCGIKSRCLNMFGALFDRHSALFPKYRYRYTQPPLAKRQYFIARVVTS